MPCSSSTCELVGQRRVGGVDRLGQARRGPAFGRERLGDRCELTRRAGADPGDGSLSSRGTLRRGREAW